MHILATTAATLDDIVEPVDLGQTPGEVAILSFSDSDLAGLAAAWRLEAAALPPVRLASLRDLRHPLSVDLWIDRVAQHAKVILVRLLGGFDWWPYGAERLSALARQRGVALALLPGEDGCDPRLAAASSLPAAELDMLLGYFRAGGVGNLRALLRRLAGHAGRPLAADGPKPLPRVTAYLPSEGAVPLERLAARLPAGLPVVPIVFYRAMLLAADTAPVDALCQALAARGLAPAPLAVAGLKDGESLAFLRRAVGRLSPAAIVAATAFATGGEAADDPFAGCDAPVLQVVPATTRRAAWLASDRGVGAADLAMHVVLPERDGRVLAGAVSFKDSLPPEEGLGFAAQFNRPEPDRVAAVADRVAALVRLRRKPRRARRVAVLLPDYPGAPGRTGYAVGLDVPASVLALLADLREAGYAVGACPDSPRALLDALAAGEGTIGGEGTIAGEGLPLDRYEQLLATLPAEAVARIRACWGEAAADADLRDGRFRFRAAFFGNALIALAPERGRVQERRADYHDPALPPRHALVAFGLWLRHVVGVDAVIHMGAHGTFEWLPGKAVALTAGCYPEIVLGSLPVIYPFIVSNPGEAAHAKRRLAAVTLGHVPPPLMAGTVPPEARELERLVDEYAQADGLDRRRRERLAKLIVETARRSGLAREAGVAGETSPDEALRRIDAWICDLKDMAVKDGLHVYGRVGPAEAGDPLWVASAAAERHALLDALDGRFIAPGPSGAPARGRRDVLPTGRNLFTVDPRAVPTPTAMDLARLAADELLRDHLQKHGEMPRTLVIDLWGSATLRTGGEEIAQGLALLGCRPVWDAATGRVTGVKVLPPAALGRPRVDVTWRVSGLFRDLFPAQIALLDAAVRAVAAREEADEDNPLVAIRRAHGDANAPALARIFGTAPGAYGTGIEDLLGRETDRAALGGAYLAAASHAYGGAEGAGIEMPGAFAARVAAADLLVHAGDDPGRDLLEGGADLGFVGGFAAAAALLGGRADLVMLDTTDPRRPRARSLAAALSRIVRARAVNPAFIQGQMRHGPRGAAELAETVDRLVGFAETTDAVPSPLLDLVHAAYLGDRQVRTFLLRENPQAARAIAERLDAARRQGLWHPRRNDIDADLAALRAEAAP